MEISDNGARALLAAIMQSAFADARRLHRAGYIGEDIRLTEKAKMESAYKAFNNNAAVVNESQQSKARNRHVNSAIAFELVAFLRSKSCAEMLEFFRIDADPIECAMRSIKNKMVNRKREV